MRDSIREVFALYESLSDDKFLNKSSSHLEQASQTAYYALRERFDDEVVVAAFLADIGRLVSGRDPHRIFVSGDSPDSNGAEFLREMAFPEMVSSLVGNQLKAKRYLSALYKGFYGELSEEDKEQVTKHGGPMNEAEAREFEKEDLFRPSVRMVLWKDKAKKQSVPGIHQGLIEAKANNLVGVSN